MRISEVKMCNHLSSMILWVTLGENNARRLFGLSGRITKPDTYVIQSIPPNMIERRRAIVNKMEEIRKINPNL